MGVPLLLTSISIQRWFFERVPENRGRAIIELGQGWGLFYWLSGVCTSCARPIEKVYPQDHVRQVDCPLMNNSGWIQNRPPL
jgi:hypothetical protein